MCCIVQPALTACVCRAEPRLNRWNPRPRIWPLRALQSYVNGRAGKPQHRQPARLRVDWSPGGGRTITGPKKILPKGGRLRRAELVEQQAGELRAFAFLLMLEINIDVLA